MPDYRRANTPGASYFFTVNTYRRWPLLVHDRTRAALREVIEAVRAEHPFTIDAWVLLPDHLHAVWTLPPGDAGFALRWGMIKRHVSRACRGLLPDDAMQSESRRARGEIAFWQRRYWEHLIRDAADYRRHIDYLHWNPIKHGLVRRVKDWPYSTFHRYARLGVYPQDWCGAVEGTEQGFGE